MQILLQNPSSEPRKIPVKNSNFENFVTFSQKEKDIPMTEYSSPDVQVAQLPAALQKRANLRSRQQSQLQMVKSGTTSSLNNTFLSGSLSPKPQGSMLYNSKSKLLKAHRVQVK
jgi:hypothetical protein